MSVFERDVLVEHGESKMPRVDTQTADIEGPW